jgi:enamine deaminase RidA (YjgF/YER057c/UK114 family)
MFIRSNIIKRAFSHHRDLIQTPGSTLPDKVKLESYVQDLTNKINHIQTKIDIINKENIIMQKYIIVNFVLTNAIFLPLIFLKH